METRDAGVPDLIPVAESARPANVHRPTVHRAIARGELPAVRVGELAEPLRVDREKFVRWLLGPGEAARWTT